MKSDFLLYGANGYTGRLIVARARKVGLRPLLAGRNADEIRALAEKQGLEYRIFALEDPAAIDAGLTKLPVVLNAAGPFSRTAEPMAEACLRRGTHYLDITGELAIFEKLHGMDGRARAAGVLLLPGAGFDVVPTDLLAAHLHRRLPTATRLRLAFRLPGGAMSRGTATTMVENMGNGGVVRRDGRLTTVPAGWRTRVVDFGSGTRPVAVTTIPWGDVSTAFHSTGIPNVEVYTRLSRAQRWMLVASRGLGWLLRSSPVRGLLLARVRAGSAGPAEERRRQLISLFHGEVEDAAGLRAVSRMRAPEGYTLTAATAVEAVRRALSGDAPPGFQTPSRAYGPDWILELDGVEREDVD